MCILSYPSSTLVVAQQAIFARGHVRRFGVAAGVLLLLLTVAGGAFYLRQPAALWDALLGHGSLPEHPAIAVLPFDDMSATHDQQYLADGITEELITGLATFPELIVMTRNATLIYKDKPTDSRQVGKDLNVSYVVEGRAGSGAVNRCTYGEPALADRYARETNSIFAIRDVPSSEQSGGWATNLRKPRSHAWPGKTRIALLHTIA